MKDVSAMRVQVTRPRLTASVYLPGAQDRLRQLILYVALRCEQAERFGLVKLNKTIWKADFDAFAARKMPVTGRTYQKLELGPAPREMLPLLKEMVRLGEIEYHETDFGDDVVEIRPIAKIPPNLSYFSRDDMGFVEASILYYWNKTGIEASDDSHGIAWKSRDIKETMYYELAYLSDEEITPRQRADILKKLAKRGIGEQPNR